MSRDQEAPAIFVVSDGRGETCHQLVRAALLQFGDQPCRIERRSEVRTVAAVEAVVGEAADARAVVFYTLVSEPTRRAMKHGAASRGVAAIDLLGPAFSALHDLFHTSRSEIPGLLYEADREEFERVEAIDYTLKHDDGQRPHELDRADVVLVGVSRSSKSSTCFFLAYEGVRAANVPLIPDVAPPPQLLALDPMKVIGLRVNAIRLQSVRRARVVGLGVEALDDYADKRRIGREIGAANALMECQGWRTVDVSYKAIEEVAKKVLELMGPRPSRPGSGVGAGRS